MKITRNARGRWEFLLLAAALSAATAALAVLTLAVAVAAFWPARRAPSAPPTSTAPPNTESSGGSFQ